MRTRSEPNVLSCGCQLGPRWRYCAHAREIARRKSAAYAEMVTNPYDARATRRYMIARDQLEAHVERHGAYTIPLQSADRVH
jgi:hypothetical protein